MLHSAATSFDSHVLKFKRAEEHLKALESEVHAFLAPGQPYDLVGKINPHTGNCTIRVQVTRHPPERLAILAGDCLQNLRSSLDHIVWQLIFRSTGEDSSDCEFPIFLSRNGYLVGERGRKLGADKVRLVDAGARTRIEQLQPYNRTNGPPSLHPLWLLHRLNNRDKHRILNLAVLAIPGVGMSMRDVRDTQWDILEQNSGSFEDEAVFARIRFWSDIGPLPNSVHLNFSGISQIAFDPKGEGRAQPLMPTIIEMLRAVDQVFVALEPFL